jgi:hypothetical protein
MKFYTKLLLAIPFVLLSISTIAQTDSEISKQINSYKPTLNTLDTLETNKKWEQKTIFNPKDKEYGGYGALTIKYGTIENSNVTFVGGRGGWILNHKLAFGFGAYGLFGEEQEPITDIKYNYTGAYGGFIVEPIFFSNKVVHFSMPILLGGGWVGRLQKVDGSYEIMYNDLVFLTVEPGLEVDFNITEHFRIAIGAYYTLANDIDSASEINDDVMNNLSVGLQFKWGVF